MSQRLAIYDFDHTVYNGDASVDFIAFLFRKRPWLLFLLPFQGLVGVLNALGLVSTKRFKEIAFLGLRFTPADKIDGLIEQFWVKNEKSVKKWFNEQFNKDESAGLHTVCVTSSPGWLIEPIAKSLGFDNVVATDMDAPSARIAGPNIKGDHKVAALKSKYPKATVVRAYSDNGGPTVDGPMLDLAEKSFIIKGEEVIKRNG